MQPIFDNLNALIIGGILILTLSVTQGRSQRAGIEQIASHSVKAKTLIFGNWVERDVLGLGANVGRNTYRFDDPVVDSLGNTRQWTFYSDSVRLDRSVLRQVVRYRLVETKTATFRDTTYQLYEVRRDSATVPVVNGVPAAVRDSDWQRGIWSIGTLSFFQIDLLDRSGTVPHVVPSDPTSPVDVDKADYVRVRFGVVPEYVLKPDNYIRELYWVRTMKVRPYWTPPACRPPACTS